ncbi:MAG: hypothetical protein N4A35_05645 [Flavobacteriales bacterium]|jgi:hypothetical protein|nr:hypothetical protein [Flavobacteriales bacterium]
MKYLIYILLLFPLLEATAQSNSNMNSNNAITPSSPQIEEELEESKTGESALPQKDVLKKERAAKTYSLSTTAEDQNSFEYNYNAYLTATVKNEETFKFLQKAYAVYPENVDLYDDFMAYYEMTDNAMDRRVFSTKLYKSNTISDYIMEYNYNVLMSLPINAILFTNGYDDTYPVWVTQDVKKVRKDVTIINVGLLKDKVYKDKVLKRAGLKYKKKYQGADLIVDVIQNNADKNIYLAMTVDKAVIQKLYQKLYLTGLVFKYSEEPIDNVLLIKEKWENQFKKTTIESPPSSFKQKQVLANYLLPFIYLHNYYVEYGDIEKAKALKKTTLKIAAYNGKKALVESKLKE